MQFTISRVYHSSSLTIAYISFHFHCTAQSPAKGCRQDELLIQCRPTEYIDVTRVLYGRQQGVGDVSCPGDDGADCGDDGASLTVVQDACQNRHQCTIPVNDGTLARNDCAGAAYLLVWNSCLEQSKFRNKVRD